MLAVHRRLGIGLPVLLTAVFLITTSSLFWHTGVSTHLSKIQLLGSGLWGNDEENDFVDGVRLVVFGDSWADSDTAGVQQGKGDSWTMTLCDELDCKTLLNFARTPKQTSALEPPNGVVTSSRVHRDAITKARHPAVNFTLPDFAAQVKHFTSLPPPAYTNRETIFVVSLGFWDVYHLAGLDYHMAQRVVDESVKALFTQLTILYTHFQFHHQTPLPDQNSTTAPTFRVVIPKVFDPSLAPGWQTQRPNPISPSNVAEQQKNAVYLTNIWNGGIETKFAEWLLPTKPPVPKEGEAEMIAIEKDVFFYDMPEYIIDCVVERSMEVEGLSDAHGMGTGDSPFEDVYLSCVSDDDDDVKIAGTGEYEEVDGKMICTNPEKHLWYDGWGLGRVANEEIGRRISSMVKSNDGLRKAFKDAGMAGFV